MRKSILILTLFLASINAQLKKFRPRPNQKKREYDLNKDFRNLTYTDKIGWEHAGFKIISFDEENYNMTEWQNLERETSGDEFYKILIPGNEGTVKIKF